MVWPSNAGKGHTRQYRCVAIAVGLVLSKDTASSVN